LEKGYHKLSVLKANSVIDSGGTTVIEARGYNIFGGPISVISISKHWAVYLYAIKKNIFIVN